MTDVPSAATTVARFAAGVPDQLSLDEYNFRHFRTRHLLYDAAGTVKKRGIRPGEIAPDFVLPRADGQGDLRLTDLRDVPVLLHFGSFT